MRVISTLHYGGLLQYLNAIPPDSVLHVYDAFTQEMAEYYYSKGIPAYIVNDHYTCMEIKQQKIYAVPLFAMAQERAFKKLIIPELKTTHCFNFMINKPMVNRFLCLKLVEWFKLSDFDYTWSAIDTNFGMENIIAEWQDISQDEISNDCRSFLLSSVSIPKKTLFANEEIVGQHLKTTMGVGTGPNNNWSSGLDTIFSGSAISLITESLGHQRGAVFTEKTLCSIVGHTFPIWIGGYRQAQEWRRVGFDIFEDIIDHSYDSYDTLIQRCYHAIADNLPLLQNKTKAAELRQQCMPRLQRNYELLQNNQIKKFVDAEIATWPEDLQQSMPQILSHFRK